MRLFKSNKNNCMCNFKASKLIFKLQKCIKTSINVIQGISVKPRVYHSLAVFPKIFFTCLLLFLYLFSLLLPTVLFLLLFLPGMSIGIERSLAKSTSESWKTFQLAIDYIVRLSLSLSPDSASRKSRILSLFPRPANSLQLNSVLIERSARIGEFNWLPHDLAVYINNYVCIQYISL